MAHTKVADSDEMVDFARQMLADDEALTEERTSIGMHCSGRFGATGLNVIETQCIPQKTKQGIPMRLCWRCGGQKRLGCMKAALNNVKLTCNAIGSQPFDIGQTFIEKQIKIADAQPGWR